MRTSFGLLRAALAEVASRLTADPAAPADPADPAPWLHLEFDIPRLGRRVDAVLVTSTAVLPIEAIALALDEAATNLAVTSAPRL